MRLRSIFMLVLCVSLVLAGLTGMGNPSLTAYAHSTLAIESVDVADPNQFASADEELDHKHNLSFGINKEIESTFSGSIDSSTNRETTPENSVDSLKNNEAATEDLSDSYAEGATGDAWAKNDTSASLDDESSDPDPEKQASELDEQAILEVNEWIIKWNGVERDPAFAENSEITYEDDILNITVAKPADHLSLIEWFRQWEASEYVQYIQPNHKVHLSAKPNDELYRFQKNLSLIQAEQAWDIVNSNTDITIAVIDTGVDLEHPDLKSNLVQGVNLVNSKATPMDDHGHGTNVAGIIAASGNNGTGITGLLWSSRLMPIKALEADGSGDEAKLGRGIRYAVDNGAKIVVLSLGLYKYSNFMQEVVEYAESKDVLLVAASGNDGRDIKYPAAYPTVLAVGGVKADKSIEPSSNYGPELDVVAPWMVFTTAKNGGYDYNEGTSMAAPQVAAVAAMIWAQNPQLKPYQVRNQIRQSAENIGRPGWDERTGYGLLRADRALSMTYKEDIYSNSTRDSAKPLSIDTMVAGTLDGGKDASWFALQAPYDGHVTFYFETDTAADKGLVELLHYKTGERDPVRYSNVTNSVTLNVKKGTSHILIQTKSRTESKLINYRLTTRFLIYRDAFAPNHRQYQAYVIPKGMRSLVGTFHQLNDQDWFVYHVEEPGTLQFIASTDSNRIDLAMLVQREGEKQQIYDFAGEGGTEYSSIMDVFPGKYYVRLTNESASRESHPVAGEYTLAIDYQKKLIDPNEPNNRSYQATVVSLNTNYQGLIDTADDVDWFAFRLEAQSYVTIQLGNIPTDRVMTASLMDSSQLQKASASNRLGNQRLTIEQLLPKGLYYVKLSANKPFQHSMYQFSVQAEKLIEGFRDISDSWAQDAIIDLTRKDIIVGYKDHTFRPRMNVTRAEATEMIVRALKLNTRASLSFSDLSRNHWAYESVLKAAHAGIVKGYDDGSFRPDRRITRAEMVVMLARAMEFKGVQGRAPFWDVTSTHWAAPMILELKNKGFISGYLDGSFRPDQNATREEFASMLYKLLNGKK